ncbi:proliferation marker protein Ki-67 [Stigmatopora nigra]
MPLHGKIVVVKRSGGDGTEFPLVASHCLFGRKPDCDIRIQIPQVSKEHCRIDLNENKEVILTNLTKVNPTLINGEVLQQPERLKGGDVITIVDRSFRFEYPPAPTPKKCVKGRKSETPKPHLKDGTNHNVERPVEQKKEKAPKEDGETQKSTESSPFNDLYQMIRKSLDVKTPCKSTATNEQTPARKSQVSAIGKASPKVPEAKLSSGKVVAESKNKNKSPTSEKRRNSKVLTADVTSPCKDGENVKCTSRQSKLAKKQDQLITSPENAKSPVVPGKGVSQKRKIGDSFDSPALQLKKKCVSFGTDLFPELFDKKLPPDSPLRKGENPRRSLSLSKPQKSLLRRASVIGLVKEAESPAKKNITSPKTSKKSPKGSMSSPGKKSPKLSTPSPCKKLTKSKPASTEVQTPIKTSPKSRSSFPASTEKTSKLSLTSSKSPKTTPAPRPKLVFLDLESPKPKNSFSGAKSPKSKLSTPSSSVKTSTKLNTPTKTSSPSRKLESLTDESMSTRASPRFTPQENVNKTPAQKVQESQMDTSSVQGRFTVSRTKTPLPIAETSTVTVTPKIPLIRKSQKMTSRKTPLAKSGIRTIIRRSGVSRASMKALCSWADTVRFGRAKIQARLPATKALKSSVVKSEVPKKNVSRAQTPVKPQLNPMSTGHADSPVTIVVGRAFKQKIANPTIAAPKVIFNTAISKKNLKMDEDLSGISEMFKTPLRDEKKRLETKSNVSKTPLAVNEPSMSEPSVLKTPEEPGEMVVSPLTLTGKSSKFNKDAIKRLLNISQECSCDTSPVETKTNSFVKPYTAIVNAVPTPKPKTPRPKMERVEDVREKLLETIKQKPEQPKSLTVKKIMKTLKQKTEPLEDLRGKILKTPKQKLQEQKECLTGVKRIFNTPEKSHPIGLRKELLKTPKSAEDDDLSRSAKQPVEKPVEDLPTPAKKCQDLPEKQKSTPAEGLLEIERLVKTPKEKSKPVEESLGVKQLMASPKLKSPASIEDFEGLQELLDDSPELQDQSENSGLKEAKELNFTQEQPQDNESSVVNVDLPQDDLPKETTEVSVECGSAEKAVSQAVLDEEPQVADMGMVPTESVISKEPVRSRRAKIEELKASEQEAVESSPVPVRAKRAKKAEPSEPEVVESSQDPVRAKRGKKSEPSDPLEEETKATPKPKRGRYVKKVEEVQEAPIESMPEPEIEECISVEMESEIKGDVIPLEEEPEKFETNPSETLLEPDNETSLPVNIDSAMTEEVVPLETETEKPNEALSKPESEISPAVDTEPEMNEKVGRPKRGRSAKKATEQIDVVPEAATETLNPESEPSLPVDVEPPVNSSVTPLEEEVVKPRRGRYAKKVLEQIDTVPKVTTETLSNPETEVSLPVDVEPPVNSSVAPLEEEEAKPKEDMEQIDVVPEVATEMLNPESETNLPVDVEPSISSSVALVEEEVVKPRRGRYAKKVLEQIDTVTTETLSNPESEASVPVDVEPPGNSSVTPLVEEVAKPRRGRYAKKTTEQIDVVPEAATETLNPETEESLPVDVEPPITSSATPLVEEVARPRRGRYAKKVLEQIDTVPKVTTETLSNPETEVSLPVDVEPPVDSSVTPLEEEVVKPRRGRYARKAMPEIDAVPVDIRPTRGRNAKKALEQTESVLELATKTEPEANHSVEEAVKPKRGRKPTQQAVPNDEPVEDLKTSTEDHENASSGSSESLNVVETEVAVDVPVLVKKSVRGKRGKPVESTAEEDTPVEDSEEADVSAPVRARRGTRLETTAPPVARQSARSRNAKAKNIITDVLPEITETAETNSIQDDVKIPVEESVKKPTRGRKPKLPLAEPPQPEIENIPDEEQSSVNSEQASGVSNSRGLRKPKLDAVTSESAENQDVPVEKPKPGSRAKQLQTETTSDLVEEDPEPEQKRTRGRVARTVLKTEIQPVVPAKRTRRGVSAASEETQKPSPVPVPDSELPSVEPVKRTRRGIAKPSIESEDSNTVTAQEETKTKFDTEVEVHDIPKTTVKVLRGKRVSPSDSSELLSKNTDKTEEELSEKPVESQPPKRTRRGAKLANEAEDTEPQMTN